MPQRAGVHSTSKVAGRYTKPKPLHAVPRYERIAFDDQLGDNEKPHFDTAPDGRLYFDPELTEPTDLVVVRSALSGRDKAIVVLGGRLGLRPQEIRKVSWAALGDGTLAIGRSQTKATARRSRVITGPAVAFRELREWQLESGGRGTDLIVGEMTENALRLWGYKRLRPTVNAATEGRITGATGYTLRHSYASACHYVRAFTLPDILRRLGHSRQTHFLHYAHVIDAIDGTRYESLDELIAAARAALGGL